MNLCFFIGKVTSEIEFKFVLNKKIYSCASFSIQLLDGTNINIKCYDSVADYSYRRLEIGSYIYCEAFLNENCIVTIYVKCVS